jgi:hypothetical protein
LTVGMICLKQMSGESQAYYERNSMVELITLK